MRTLQKISLGKSMLFVATLFFAQFSVAQTYTNLYSYGTQTGDPRNPTPAGIMSQGRDGNLYSATAFGGATNLGAAFKVTPSGTLTKLADFNTGPSGGLTLGTDGNFYGTTNSGGTSQNVGTIFKITPTGHVTTLWNFTGTGADEGVPFSPVFQGQDGNFYGTDQGVFTGTYGVLYKMTPAGVVTPLATFDFTHGATPNLPTQGTDGNFYGTTRGGGGPPCSGGCGVVYKVTPAGKLTTLHVFTGFPSDGSLPTGVLVQGADGSFYGTTFLGGANNTNKGTVFKISPTGVYKILHSFNDVTGNDGYQPWTGLALGSDGNLYGTAQGGTHNAGVLFKITPAGQLTILYNFCSATGCADGFFPQTPVMQHTDGKFYGSVESGGVNGLNGGVFYSLDMGLKAFVGLVNWTGKVGKSVEVLGQGFTGTTKVTFNGKVATFNVVSDTYLTAVVPAGATTGPVSVVTPSGTLKSNRKFLVTPSITSFAPTSGAEGDPVTITGVSLTGATRVTFGGKAATFRVNSDTTISTTVPTGAVTGKIQVTTPGGIATSTTNFTVTP